MGFQGCNKPACCRNRAYAARGFSQPPSIENAASHPFLKELDAKESDKSPAADEASPASAAQQSAAARPAVAAPKAVRAPAAAPVLAAASAAPPAQLLDLLSLDDVSKLPLRAPQSSIMHNSCDAFSPHVSCLACRRHELDIFICIPGDISVKRMRDCCRHQQQALLPRRYRPLPLPHRMRAGLPSWMLRLLPPPLLSPPLSRLSHQMTTGMLSRCAICPCTKCCHACLSPRFFDCISIFNLALCMLHVSAVTANFA